MSFLFFSIKHLYIALFGALLPIIINHLIGAKSEGYYFQYKQKITVNQFFGIDLNSNRRHTASWLLLTELIVYGFFMFALFVIATFIFMWSPQKLVNIEIKFAYFIFGVFFILFAYSVKRKDSFLLSLFFGFEALLSISLTYMAKNIFDSNSVLRVYNNFHNQYFYYTYGFIRGFYKMLLFYGQHKQKYEPLVWYTVTIKGIRFFTWTYILTRSLAFAFVGLVMMAMLITAAFGFFRKGSLVSVRMFVVLQLATIFAILLFVFYPSITYYVWR